MPFHARRPRVFPAVFAVVAALVVLVAATSPAAAFDGSRKGFVMGGNVGYGWLSVPTSSGHKDGSGLVTGLKIGAGLNDRTVIHYAGKQLLNISDNSTYTQLFPMIGVTHYLKEQSSSAFLTGGAGVGVLAGFEYEDISGGFSLFGGGGYEFARHWSVEFDYVNTWEASGGSNTRNTSTIMATIGVLAY